MGPASVRLTLDELAQIRCIADGALPPVLAVHAAAIAGDELTLVDDEGVPVGRLDVAEASESGGVRGSVTILAAPTAPTYTALRRPANDSDRPAPSGTVLAFVGEYPPSPAELAAARAELPGADVVLGLAVGGGLRADDAAHHRAIRSWLAFRDSWAGPGTFELVLTSLWAAADEATRLTVGRAYGATHPVLTANGQPPAPDAGATVLFTGLSGSGKSTVAHELVAMLTEQYGRSVTLLDGDVVRTHLSSELGFSRAHRDINIRRIGWVAAEVTKHGGLAVAAPIAPYAATRAEVRAMVEAAGGPESFVLVHVATPLAECERRDRKGLYAKARRGELPEFTGISDPYESPDDATVTIDTTDVSAADAAREVLAVLVKLGKV